MQATFTKDSGYDLLVVQIHAESSERAATEEADPVAETMRWAFSRKTNKTRLKESQSHNPILVTLLRLSQIKQEHSAYLLELDVNALRITGFLDFAHRPK
jgi:hypothetical protein